MSADLFTTAETTLAQALNLPRKVIKTVRTDHLERGTDWDYSTALRSNGAVYFSRAGIEATLKHLSIPPEKIALLLPPPSGDTPAVAAPASDSSPNDPPAATAGDPEPPLALGEPAVIEATVKRCYPLNRKIVGCTIKDADVRVKVRSNEKLRPGMVLHVSLVEGDLYEMAERLPRWPGKR